MNFDAVSGEQAEAMVGGYVIQSVDGSRVVDESRMRIGAHANDHGRRTDPVP